VQEHGARLGVMALCTALCLARATYYRRQRRAAEPPAELRRRPAPPRALCSDEQAQVLEVLRSERFVDKAPREVYATLLDEGQYLCSPSTMYRLLRDAGEVRERRDQLQHPEYKKPELLATGPNQVWSWDITKLRGPAKWTYHYLYVVLDIFSRYVVGWMIADNESAELAKDLIAETCTKQRIEPGTLTIHMDRGSPMTSKSFALLLADLGISKSHSRPHVSDDNPFSEAQFKTLKYRPGLPDSYGSVEHARACFRPLFHWYNHEHHHAGLGLLTPDVVHHGRAADVLAGRQRVLLDAWRRHPERFVRKLPTPAALPPAVGINLPLAPHAAASGPAIEPATPASAEERA
jgi:putative transposase